MKLRFTLLLLLISTVASAQYKPPYIESDHPSPTTDQKLLDIKNNGSTVFSVDAEGDVEFPGTITGNGSGLTGVTAAAVGWSDITSRPSGLDDGDDDTTYSAGDGIDITGTTVSIGSSLPFGDFTFGDDGTNMMLEVNQATVRTFWLSNTGSSVFDLLVDGEITGIGGLTIGDDDSNDDILTMGAGTLKWDEDPGEFVFSNNLKIGVDDTVDDVLTLGGGTITWDESTGWLIAGNNVRGSGYIEGRSLSAYDASDSDYIYFGNGAESLNWNNSVFQLTDDLIVSGYLGATQNGSYFNGNLRLGASAGGTYNGNWYFSPGDQYPSLISRAGTTNLHKLYPDAYSGHLYLDAVSDTYDFFYRNSTYQTIFSIDTGSRRVGINTAAPLSQLHVHEALGGQNAITLTNADTGTTATDGGALYLDSLERLTLMQYEPKSLFFGTNATIRDAIDCTGKWGLGTTSPAEKLDLDGNFKMASDGIFYQAQNGTTGPDLLSGLLSEMLYNNGAMAFDRSIVGYVDSTPATGKIVTFKLGAIPERLRNGKVILDQLIVKIDTAEATDKVIDAYIYKPNGLTGRTEVVHYTTDFSASTNILSSDVSRITYSDDWYLELVYTVTTAVKVEGVTIQYHFDK